MNATTEAKGFNSSTAAKRADSRVVQVKFLISSAYQWLRITSQKPIRSSAEVQLKTDGKLTTMHKIGLDHPSVRRGQNSERGTV
jgi:hypothetical protein